VLGALRIVRLLESSIGRLSFIPWMVALQVFPSSPAARAGLQAHSDYLLGSQSIIFKGGSRMADAAASS
jgi:hypothetical protein